MLYKTPNLGLSNIDFFFPPERILLFSSRSSLLLYPKKRSHIICCLYNSPCSFREHSYFVDQLRVIESVLHRKSRDIRRKLLLRVPFRAGFHLKCSHPKTHFKVVWQELILKFSPFWADESVECHNLCIYYVSLSPLVFCVDSKLYEAPFPSPIWPGD